MSFELWLFTIKRLGTTMDVAKTIFDRMPPDMQQKLRDEYDREYGGGGNDEPSKPQVRITVVKRECYKDLQKKYLDKGNAGPCPYFKDGQEFIVDEDSFAGCMNGKFCADAWDAVSRYVYAALQGGTFKRGHSSDDNVMIACCNDGTRPVVFKLEKLD